MYLLFAAQKLTNIFADSAVAILPVSVRLIEKPVNRKLPVNREHPYMLPTHGSRDYGKNYSASSNRQHVCVQYPLRVEIDWYTQWYVLALDGLLLVFLLSFITP